VGHLGGEEKGNILGVEYQISYSPLSMWFKVSSHNIPPLRVHAMITGIDKFQEHYIKYMPEEKWETANEKFMQDKRVNK